MLLKTLSTNVSTYLAKTTIRSKPTIKMKNVLTIWD